MEGGDLDMNKRDEAMVSLPSGAGKERKKNSKLVKKKLKQEMIDLILKEPFEPLGDEEEEEVQGMSEPYRACHAKTMAAFQALAEFDADIIRQYQAKGYAEVHIPLADSGDSI